MSPDEVQEFANAFARLVMRQPKGRAELIEREMREFVAASREGKPYAVSLPTLIAVNVAEQHVQHGTPLLIPESEMQHAMQATLGATLRMN